MEEKSDDILYIGFNQDFSCFSLGTERGFKILNTYPFKDTFKRGRVWLLTQNLTEELELWRCFFAATFWL